MKCPYGCIDEDFVHYDCPEEPGAKPQDGDVGVCYRCGGWWQLQTGVSIPYTPMPEELARTTPQIGAAHERFKGWADTPEGQRAYAEWKRKRAQSGRQQR